MNYSKHCDLCVSQKISLKRGNICGLTDKKPTFKKKCYDIHFNSIISNELESVSIELKKINNLKLKNYIGFTMYFTFSLTIMIIGFLFFKEIWKKEIYSEYPSVIIAIGYALMGVSFFNLQKFLRKKRDIKIRKDQIDEMLDIYNIKYDIEVVFGKEIHGIEDIKVDLKMRGIR